MNQLADKVVAYRLPDEGDEEMYGLCIRREGETLRVMALQREDNREMPLRSVLRKLSDEDGIVNSLEDRFGALQSRLAKERSAVAQAKGYRLQETMLQWAAHRLDSIDVEEWKRLAQERHPSTLTKAVGCAAASIATDAKLVSSAWSDAQKFFMRGKDLVADLRRAGERRLGRSLYNSLEEGYASDPSLSYSLVAQESSVLSILHKWITALVDYQRARYMEDGEAELQQQLTGCQNSLQSARERRGSLMEQAELINMGNCYIRTQTVRSVPLDCVLYLMTAEKVTTRQYLLKEAATLETLDEVLNRQPNSARSARGSRQEDAFSRNGFLSARTVDAPSLGSNRTNTGVEIPPIHIPKAQSARVGTWVGGRLVRRQFSAEKSTESGATGGASSGSGVGSTVPKVSPRHAFASTAADTVESGMATPGSVANAAHNSGTAVVSPSPSSTVASPPTPPIRVERKQRSESALQPRGPEPMQVLTDVRNNFQNVQAVLLDCLEDYQKLEDKYASTVEHSRQLLQTLESRDQLIARLQQDLATTAAAAAACASSANGKSSHLGGTVDRSAVRRDWEGMYTSSAEPPSTPKDKAFADVDTFECQFEEMLHDTLEFLRGAELAPAIYESETDPQ